MLSLERAVDITAAYFERKRAAESEQALAGGGNMSGRLYWTLDVSLTLIRLALII